MNLRTIIRFAAAHLTSNDIVGLLLAAAMLGPLCTSAFGFGIPMPLGLPGIVVFLVLTVAVGVIYLAGVRARNDFTLARLYWELGLLIPASFLFGWLVYRGADPFFTAESLYQVCAILLVLSILAGLLERRAAKGTPSDVLASVTTKMALVGLVLFWALVAAVLQPAASVFLLLAGILILLTVLLRLPGAIVPIYRVRWPRRRRNDAKAK